MAKVITMTDIAAMKDKKQLTLSKGTIVTPSARDWASEHGICIMIEEDGWGREDPGQVQEKMKLLNQLIENIVKQTKNKGIPLKKDELSVIVRSCLEKMNCVVE